MTKKEFLSELERSFSTLPRRERRERLGFYSEMIDDRMEEGLSEEEAVLAIGPLPSAASDILAEDPPKTKKGGRTVLTVLLWVFASPILLSLAAAALSVLVSLLAGALSVLLSLVAALWSLVISAFAVFLSLAVAGLGSLVLGGVFLFFARGLEGVATMAAGLIVASLSVLFVFPCRYAVKVGVVLTVLAWRGAVLSCRAFVKAVTLGRC